MRIAIDDNDSESWARKTFNVASTAGSIGGKVGILFEAPQGTSNGNFLTVDDVSLSVIPEPATLGLLGICGLAIAWYRRKFVC